MRTTHLATGATVPSTVVAVPPPKSSSGASTSGAEVRAVHG